MKSAMAINAAGLDVSGRNNPNWKGGKIQKVCSECRKEYLVKQTHSKSKYCSLQCTGKAQTGVKRTNKKVELSCEVCGSPFSVYPAHVSRSYCCSKACSHIRRSSKTKGENNPSWNGGASRLPYPWNFGAISKFIIERDGHKCQNPSCRGEDSRLTTHHINYDKRDCSQKNLIALCSSCNSRANYGREQWEKFYSELNKRRCLNENKKSRGSRSAARQLSDPGVGG